MFKIDGYDFSPKNITERIKKQVIDKNIEITKDRIIKNVGKCSIHPDNEIIIEINLSQEEFDRGFIKESSINIKNICCEQIENKKNKLNDEGNLFKE